MVKKNEYDFLNWKSFPSSAKITVAEEVDFNFWPFSNPISVTPGRQLRLEVQVKQENVTNLHSHIAILEWDGKGWKRMYIDPPLGAPGLPLGTFDWNKFTALTELVPTDVSLIRVAPVGGVGITWFDDLKVYQDEKLIFSEDFSNWNPYIGAGVGAGGLGLGSYAATRDLKIAVPLALVGAGLGAFLGSLTAKA
jgi:hypothetical protein